ncbi:M28 family peptidase [Halalkalibacterium halodurans]|uniref:Aminopeptidase n=2 Tax=Halalkalibacterium halodurans TaxID=86665 RepID=Q9K671_HALH5|nr:M28 family peptidase [Halalkalibacterium halodurans]MDY7224365.1 M28 family peptidase [Halalkalibacterium halodurans]MDY7243650.1 M28 family peptidase [Halalkalibacterium halodurans]MED3645864.1 M28 family peptidase [Halalkalibacterium halodurans]MED4079570.1 M28 family peptidase [Halalkalibacterium halodurans]MED4084153.1 M28 family peptidase [Halalkalibacterium halodurans]
MRKQILVAAMSAVIVAGSVFIPGAASPFSTAKTVMAAEKNHAPFDQKIVKRFNADNAYDHIYHLSETIGPRVAGSQEEKEGAAYLQAEFSQLGYDVDVQTFSIPDRLFGSLTVNGEDIPIRPSTGSSPTPEGGLTAPLYDAGLGYPEDFTEEAEGKVALISRGGFTFAEKAQNAVDAGAVAVIIYNNVESLVPLTPSLGGSTISVPVVGTSKESGAYLLEQEEVTLELQALTNQTSQNVIAVRKPHKKIKNPEIVYVTAHYDSVPLAPGANDNASGTGVMLELARVLKSYPLDKELRFIGFGAEEIGLVGARYYVAQLSSDEIERSVANFNMDMVGTSWEPASKLFVNVTDGSPNIVWQISSKVAERLGHEPLLLNQGGSSDHVAFHEVGIESANFIRREPGTGALEPWYHTPFDTVENISVERLQEAGEIVGASVYELVRKETNRKNKQNKAQSIQPTDIYSSLQ